MLLHILLDEAKHIFWGPFIFFIVDEQCRIRVIDNKLVLFDKLPWSFIRALRHACHKIGLTYYMHIGLLFMLVPILFLFQKGGDNGVFEFRVVVFKFKYNLCRPCFNTLLATDHDPFQPIFYKNAQLVFECLFNNRDTRMLVIKYPEFMWTVACNIK